jgi:hypothetical protein
VPHPVTVSVVTTDRAAESPFDYTPVSTILKFAPGTTVRKLAIDVAADTVPERDETFAVRLTGVTGAEIADPLGIATIVNDD